MACCGKNRQAAARPRPYGGNENTQGSTGVATQTFSLIIEGQEPQGFGSRLEADAENARSGYVGIVRQNGA